MSKGNNKNLSTGQKFNHHFGNKVRQMDTQNKNKEE